MMVFFANAGRTPVPPIWRGDQRRVYADTINIGTALPCHLRPPNLELSGII